MIILAIIDKEFRQIARDWRTLVVLLVIPMFLLIMFGYAISLDVKNVGIAIVDYDHSVESRRLIASLQHSEYFVIKDYIESVTDVASGILADRETAALVIPRGFARSILRGEPATVQLLVDGSNGTSASAVLGYLQRIVGQFGAVVARADGVGRPPLVGVEPRVWFNPELESSQFLVPGLAAFILIITAVVSTALSVVREKELGTLEQIAVSPIRPIQLVIGKTIPYTVISAIVAATVFVSAAVLFNVHSAGGYGWLTIVTMLYLFACIGFGVMISSLADSQQVAFLIAIMITFLPSFILSGFIFPIDNMPPIIQVATYLVPARYYLAALREIMLRGVGIRFFWQDIALLALFAATTIAIGVRRLTTESDIGMNVILTIVRKEFIQIFRDRKMLPILFVAPVLQLVLLGYAANLDVDNLRLAVYDQDRSVQSRALTADFLNTAYFVAAAPIYGANEVERSLLSGEADLVVVIPGSFGSDITAGRSRLVQVIVDGSNSTKGTAALNYSGAVVERFAAALTARALGRTPAPAVILAPRVWFNPEMETRNFMVPGVLALLLMVITMMLSSLAIVKEKELGTLEQLNVTPIRPWQLIIGKLVPFIVIGIIDVILVVLVARSVFAVPFRGSVLLLLLMSLVFLGTTLGLGLLVSSISQTQQQAMMTSVFFLMMPMIFLSGFAFPIESMPRIIQYVTYLLPLRYYFVIVRGIFLKGSGIAVLWDEGLALLAFGTAAIVIGSLRFRKRAS